MLVVLYESGVYTKFMGYWEHRLKRLSKQASKSTGGESLLFQLIDVTNDVSNHKTGLAALWQEVEN